jgi:hypothetical protein
MNISHMKIIFMALIYTNIILSKALQNIHNMGFLVG